MVSLTTISDDARGYWDTEVPKLDMCHPLNAFGWGKVRSADGWTPQYLMVKRQGAICGAAILLTKTISFLPFSVLYMPRGPICHISDTETISAITGWVREIAKKTHAIFLRIEPNLPEADIKGGDDPFIAVGFRHLRHRWSFWNGPRDVVRVNLKERHTVDDLFLSMKKDARRGVKRAIREGVRIRKAQDIGDLKTFYGIFQHFSREKGFMSRGYSYQRSLWDEYLSCGNGLLLLAEYRGKAVGGILNLVFARKCLGMHGAVLSTHRKLKIHELLEWEGMKWAKENGCQWYSFRGKGPTISHLSFKMKFGSEVVPLVGYYDLPFHLRLYRVLNWLEFSVLPRLSMPIARLLYLHRRFNP